LGGLDTKTDPKLVQFPNLTDLQNGVFESSGRIIKRNGYDLLGNSIVGSTGSLVSGSALGVFNSELLRFIDNSVYTRDQASDGWVNKGNAVPCTTFVVPAVRNSAAQSIPDFATLNGINVIAYADSRGGVRAIVTDSNTNAQLVSDTQLNASGDRPRVVVIGSKIWVFYAVSTSIKAVYVDAASPGSFSAEFTLVTDLSATAQLDIIPNGTSALIAYNASAGVKIAYITQDGVIGSALNGFSNPLTYPSESAQNSIAIIAAGNNFFICYHNSTTGLIGLFVSATLTEVLAPTVIDSTTSPIAENITAVYADSTVTVYYQVASSTSYNTYTKRNTITSAGSVGSASVFNRSLGLAAKAFRYNSRTYIPCVYDSTLQSTYFIVQDDGFIAAKMAYQVAGGLTSKSMLPGVTVDDNAMSFAQLAVTQIISENGALSTRAGVNLYTVTFDNPYMTARLGNNLNIGGGIVSLYDGQSVVEQNFNVYPEQPALSASLTGGSMQAGTYQYIALYRWTDNQGMIHRSNTSVALTGAISAGSTRTDDGNGPYSENYTKEIPSFTCHYRDLQKRRNNLWRDIS
jgi:hypothetical protein